MMNRLVVYDSQYGNTQKIAEIIAKSLSGTRAVRAAEVDRAMLDNLAVLIVGSPTQGGRPTSGCEKFLRSLPDGCLAQTKVAAFDTRLREANLSFWLKMLVRTIGFAAPKIMQTLISKGGRPIVGPEGFAVQGKEGPLVEGEPERAREWIRL